jgi:predicted phage terminase large subunit-like protein
MTINLNLDPKKLLKLPKQELIKRLEAKQVLDLRTSKRLCAKSLTNFIKEAWHIVEPSNPYVHGWHIDAVAMHLEAVEDGEITRLLVNIPPGMMKSLLTSVFFPAWIWGPKGRPATRFLCTAHNQNLAIRDSLKMRRLVTSEWYQQRWGDTVKITSDQSAKTKFENTATGFREAVAFESMTGARGDIVILDDPHSVDSAMSDALRESTITTFREALPTRLNNPEKSAIIVIMQRLHEKDVSGVILDEGLPYCHLMLPQEFDPIRRCETEIGFVDPREEEGQLLFPGRFPREVVERDKQVLGPYGYAGQFQQSPSPRGGGIIKREWWTLYDDEEANAQGSPGAHKYPQMDYIIASLDPAYTEKQENDPSGFTIWGVFQRGGTQARRILSQKGDIVDILDDRDTLPSVMLMYAWAKRLPIHGPEILKEPGETERAFKLRQQASWGLVEHIVDSCNRYNIDKLLIEAKGPGLSVAQEIKRLNRTNSWTVELVNPGNRDKVARAYAVQPVFASGAVFAPDKSWADAVITEWEQFPKGKHDDLVDSTTQALWYMRERGLLQRSEEVAQALRESAQYKPPAKVVYDV